MTQRGDEMSEGTYGKLAERFPAEAHKTRKQGGQDLVYVTGEMVISRLNEALGVTGWSWRVVREGMTDVEIGKLFNTSRSTIQYRRTSSFEILKKYLEEHADEWDEW